MTRENIARFGTQTVRYIIVLVILIVIAGSATYAVMSDTSIHGLTVRFYNNVSRYCTNSTLTFNFNQVVVYSTTSLETSLSHVHFTMSADGVLVGTVSAQDSRFGPGQSVSYYSLTFSNATLDPHSQPLKSQIALGVTALVSAGLYSSTTTTSDSELVTFSGPPC
jgi:cytochrome c biogenesis factor